MSTTATPVEAIYQDAKDKRVSNYVLYGNASKLYLEAAHTTEVSHDDALDALLHGALVVDATAGYSTVTSFKDSDGTLTVKVGTTTYTVGASAPTPTEPEE